MKSKLGIAVRFVIFYTIISAALMLMGRPQSPLATTLAAAVMAYLTTPCKIHFQTESFKKPF